MTDQASAGGAERDAAVAGRRPPARIGWRLGMSQQLVEQVALIVALLVLWEIASYTVTDPFWSSRPSLIGVRLWELTVSGDLWTHVSVTVLEAFTGLMLGAVVGVSLGIALARSPRLASMVDPLITGLYGLPRVALAPLFILWFGIGLLSKVMMAFFMVVFIFLLNVMEGVRTIDQDHLDLMKSMRAKRVYLVRNVLLPSIVPWILASFRIGVGLALIGAVVGELIGANRGLGWYVSASGGMLDTTGVFTGLLLLMAIAMAANAVVRFVERRVVRWR